MMTTSKTAKGFMIIRGKKDPVVTLNPCGHLHLDEHFTFENECPDCPKPA